MTAVVAQVRREFLAFFFSPVGWVLIAASAILNAAMFVLLLEFLSGPNPVPGAPMQMMFSWILYWIIALVVSPLITMRSFAEEKHAGTLETLLTAPISDTAVVLAKFVACAAFYIVLWSPTFLYPFLLSRHTPIDMGPVFAGYLGTFGIGIMFMAVGILCSVLTRNQIVAALLGFGAVMLLFLAGLFSFTPEVSFGGLLSHINLLGHMEDFAKGIVDTRYLVYYASVSALCLFLAVQVLQSRRWRG
ncbi:MAG: ABC transporter permease subunit [Proteobacteria bacterium]|nr:ABC transporter permease subunit [Pseudomonadota bacterium]